MSVLSDEIWLSSWRNYYQALNHRLLVELDISANYIADQNIKNNSKSNDSSTNSTNSTNSVMDSLNAALDNVSGKTFENSKTATLISGTEYADTISNIGERVTIKADKGNDSIYSSSVDSVIIYGDDGNDTIHNKFGDKLIIYGNYGKDSINNYIGYEVTVSGGAGDDTILGTYNEESSLSGGSGNDIISLYGGSYQSGDYQSAEHTTTVNGGIGNDTVYFGNYSEIFQYNSGDGNDVLFDFSNIDQISITGGNYTTLISGNDVVVSVGTGNITLKDSANLLTININGTNIVNSVDNSVNNVTYSYTYSGGNQVISNYSEGKPVNLTSDLTGININENNFYVISSSGALEIQNVRGKFVDYSYLGSDPIAYSYLGNRSGAIDGRGKNGRFGIMVGANNTDNQIYAGNGGSSLWGGSGGNDTLIGGAGYDEFVYKIGSGRDVIQGASDIDVVNLEGVSMSQIVTANVESSKVYAKFTDGGSLEIQSSANVGFKVGGEVWAANRSNGTWYKK